MGFKTKIGLQIEKTVEKRGEGEKKKKRERKRRRREDKRKKEESSKKVWNYMGF